MKKIIPYSLFEGVSNINEKEVESIITDICADFMDEYDVVIDFDWGWVVPPDLRSDRQTKMFREKNTKPGNQLVLIQKYLDEVDSSNNRFVTVEFSRPKDYSTLNIWKDEIEKDYKKIMDFAKDYFSNVEVVNNSPVITDAIWAISFSIIFK